MNLLEFIPKGRRNRVTMEYLMFKCDIFDKDTFKQELRELKRTNIILFDDGYYIPEGKEVQEFIDKCNLRIKETQELISLAKKLMN